MKKTLLAIVMLVSSVASAKSQVVLFAGSNYKIVSDTPYESESAVVYNNIRIEVQSRTHRLIEVEATQHPLTDSELAREIFQKVCLQKDFWQVRVGDDEAGVFEKSVEITEEGLVYGNHWGYITNLTCAARGNGMMVGEGL